MNFLASVSAFERRDLLVAWIALAIAFTFAFSGGLRFFTDAGRVPVTELAATFCIALLTVGLSFVCHELAHKFTAMRFGYWAEFRKSTQMLLVAVAVAVVTGIVFAAPGATLIGTAGRGMTKHENGIISVAGPLTNLVLAVPFFVIMVAGIVLTDGSQLLLNDVFSLSGFLFSLGSIGFMVNAMLAFFNMLPAGPLDGKKILAWNPAVFAVVILVAVCVLFVALQPELILGKFYNP
jgi:Zn-dependent protease